VWIGWYKPAFRRTVLPSSSGLMITSALKMETASFSETLASNNQFTLQLNPKEHNQYSHRSENVRSHTRKAVFVF
jgi:hypothetical protein